ncbi:MAG: hypothetical protein IJD93_05190 [Ruminococcus sp.]|nr:hypothetical protein [Ruminococcus sp.]
MDYKIWSQEYMDEAQKVLRNIDILKEKQKTAPLNQRQTIADNIQKLRLIYYECVHTAAYIAGIAKERSNVA